MKMFVLRELNDKSFDSFVEFMNKLDKKDMISIVVDSTGGDTTMKDTLVKIINENKDSIVLIVQIAMSNAFELLMETKCPCVILKSSYAMVHKGSWNVAIRDGGIYHGTYSDFQKREMEKYGTMDRSFLTNEELELYNRGEDIYLDSDRIKKILKLKGRKEDLKDESVFL